MNRIKFKRNTPSAEAVEFLEEICQYLAPSTKNGNIWFSEKRLVGKNSTIVKELRKSSLLLKVKGEMDVDMSDVLVLNTLFLEIE